jgi:hypothetical protein
MGLESATFLSGLVATNPIGATDPKSQGDDHIRLIKSVLLATFPNLNAAVTATPAQLNLLVGQTLLYQPSFVFKAALTDRNSGGTGTTFTDDPDLAGIALSVGTHLYDAHFNWQTLTTTAQGIKFAMIFSGTADIHNGDYEGFPAGAGFFLFIDPATSPPITNFGSVPNTANANVIIKVRMLIRVTVAGTLKLQWAQSVANANSTRLDKGSYIRTQRMV